VDTVFADADSRSTDRDAAQAGIIRLKSSPHGEDFLFFGMRGTGGCGGDSGCGIYRSSKLVICKEFLTVSGECFGQFFDDDQAGIDFILQLW